VTGDPCNPRTPVRGFLRPRRLLSVHSERSPWASEGLDWSGSNESGRTKQGEPDSRPQHHLGRTQGGPVGTTERAKSITTPWKAFALVLTLATIATTTIYLTTRPTASQSESPNPAPNSARERTAVLLEEVAALTNLRFAAYESKDLEALDSFLTAESPLRPIVSQEISNLIDRGVDVDIDFEVLDISLISVSTDKATVRQEIEQSVVARNQDGEKVDRRAGSSVRTIRWTLRWTNAGWRFHNSRLLSDRRVT
jgi:hypothetical protein